MKKLLGIILAVGLLATVAGAQDLILTVARDNANDTSSPLLNYGRNCNVRFAKDKQESTLYGDWDPADMATLATMIEGLDESEYTVEFRAAGVSWEGPNPSAVIWVETFRSVNDWLVCDLANAAPGDGSATECDNGAAEPSMGACHLYASDSPAGTIPWVNPDTMATGNFWAMPARLNSVPIVGYVPSTVDPITPGWNTVVLDNALVLDLISDRETTYVRGLRCWSEDYLNHQVYARGQWGCPGPAAAQLVLTLGGGPVLPYPGDTQPDGKVDGGDYTVWADNYGKTDAPLWSAGGWTVGNFTEDANVDGGDYTVWADEYGYGTGAAAVPEPVTLALLAIGAVAVFRRRK